MKYAKIINFIYYNYNKINFEVLLFNCRAFERD